MENLEQGPQVSKKQDMCGTEALALAQMLCLHGLLVPCFRRTSWAKAQPECTGASPKKETRGLDVTWCLLDIMARKFYLLQEAIYSNGQTMISNYNETKIGKGDNGKQ